LYDILLQLAVIMHLLFVLYSQKNIIFGTSFLTYTAKCSTIILRNEVLDNELSEEMNDLWKNEN